MSGADPFIRNDHGELTCDGLALRTIAREHGTPTFVYSASAMRARLEAIDRSLAFAPHLVAYAMKANDNLAVLATLSSAGAGADIVSGGELARALRAGVAPEKIVFSGVGKQGAELEAAVAAGIRAIHVESEGELRALASISKKLGRTVPIALRINPDVNPQTHPYIATGIHGTKFGLELEAARELLPRILEDAHLRLEGIACHIGSQIATPAPLAEAVERTTGFALECRAAGAPIRCIDAGGGWPITYGNESHRFPDISEFGNAIRLGIEHAGAQELGLEVLVEPGRSLVGDAGILLTEVIYTKQQREKRFVVVDAAMTELIRPALYEAHHVIEPVAKVASDALSKPQDVVGPVCETGDFLARGRMLPLVERGDLLAVHSAGAYGAVMASRYNARRRAAEVLVEDGTARLVRRRETYEDLWRGEVM